MGWLTNKSSEINNPEEELKSEARFLSSYLHKVFLTPNKVPRLNLGITDLNASEPEQIRKVFRAIGACLEDYHKALGKLDFPAGYGSKGVLLIQLKEIIEMCDIIPRLPKKLNEYVPKVQEDVQVLIKYSEQHILSK